MRAGLFMFSGVDMILAPLSTEAPPQQLSLTSDPLADDAISLSVTIDDLDQAIFGDDDLDEVLSQLSMPGADIDDSDGGERASSASKTSPAGLIDNMATHSEPCSNQVNQSSEHV